MTLRFDRAAAAGFSPTSLLAAAIVALVAIAPVDARAQGAPADPFAGLEPMDDATLKEKRGGFRSGDNFVEFAGFFIEIGLQDMTLIEELSAEGLAVQESMRIRQNADATALTVINNTQDNVRVTRAIEFDVVVSNFDAAVAQSAGASAAMSAVSGALTSSRLFSSGPFD
ncbi:MAG: hypothetical protein ACFB00_10685 [Parvularculaceae bacterium]